MMWGRNTLGGISAAMLAMVAICGCTFSIGNDNSDDSNTNRGSGGPDEGDLRVEFRNLLTRVDVDTEFYATNDELDNPFADLFVPAYRIQVGVGVAGTGILQAQTDDAVDVPCTDNLIIGTTGGTFKDPDTGATLGQGDQRLLQVGLIFDCGDTVTFTYASDGDAFTVDIL